MEQPRSNCEHRIKPFICLVNISKHLCTGHYIGTAEDGQWRLKKLSNTQLLASKRESHSLSLELGVSKRRSDIIVSQMLFQMPFLNAWLIPL